MKHPERHLESFINRLKITSFPVKCGTEFKGKINQFLSFHSLICSIVFFLVQYEKQTRLWDLQQIKLKYIYTWWHSLETRTTFPSSLMMFQGFTRGNTRHTNRPGHVLEADGQGLRDTAPLGTSLGALLHSLLVRNSTITEPLWGASVNYYTCLFPDLYGHPYHLNSENWEYSYVSNPMTITSTEGCVIL